jgi:hypothetical protein
MDKVQEGPSASFQRWVNTYKEALKENGNYSKAPHHCRKHPKEDYEYTIKSLQPTGGEQHRGCASPIPTGDKTTWLSGGLEGHHDTAEDPHTQEGEARAHLGAEHGAATRLTVDSGSILFLSLGGTPQSAKNPEAPKNLHQA